MANDLLNLTKQEIQKIQYDVLWSSIVNNGYLPASEIAVLNKSLKTDSKIIIKAINEVLAKAEAAELAVNRFKDRFNTTIGDEISDRVLREKLDSLGTNVINVMYDLKNGFRDVLNATDETEERLEEFRTILATQSEELNRIINEYDLVIEEVVPEFDNCFRLSHTPLKNDKFRIYINGLRYPLSCFETLENNRFLFKFDALNNGFTLDSNYEILVEYTYDHELEENNDSNTGNTGDNTGSDDGGNNDNAGDSNSNAGDNSGNTTDNTGVPDSNNPDNTNSNTDDVTSNAG